MNEQYLMMAKVETTKLYRLSDRHMSVKLVPNLLIEGVSWSAQRIPTAVNLGFQDRSL
jgi:hypothetical protein